MSDSEGGGGHKVGIVAAIVAALGGIGKFADDCGRAAHVGSVANVGDDALRGAGRLGGVGDDVGRAGLNAGDDALRAGGLPGALEAGAHVRLGEGPLAKVADDVAPGMGSSVEEALLETGVNITMEVASFDLPDGEQLEGAALALPPSKPVVNDTDRNAVHAQAFQRAAVPGALIVLAGEADAAGAIQFGEARLGDGPIHVKCAEAGARCLILRCDPKIDPICLSVASGIGRMAASRVATSGSLDQRYAQLTYAAQDQRAKTGAVAVHISRIEAKADKIVRSSLSSIERR